MEDKREWGLVYFPYLRMWDIVSQSTAKHPLKYKDLTWDEAKALLLLLKESEHDYAEPNQ